MEDIRKGFLFLSKIVYKRVRGWTPGWSLRCIKLCLAPSPPPGFVLNVRDKGMITWQAFLLKRIAKKSHGSDILKKGRSANQIATNLKFDKFQCFIYEILLRKAACIKHLNKVHSPKPFRLVMHILPYPSPPYTGPTQTPLPLLFQQSDRRL